jgi:hypothetical protein
MPLDDGTPHRSLRKTPHAQLGTHPWDANSCREAAPLTGDARWWVGLQLVLHGSRGDDKRGDAGRAGAAAAMLALVTEERAYLLVTHRL